MIDISSSKSQRQNEDYFDCCFFLCDVHICGNRIISVPIYPIDMGSEEIYSENIRLLRLSTGP